MLHKKVKIHHPSCNRPICASNPRQIYDGRMLWVYNYHINNCASQSFLKFYLCSAPIPWTTTTPFPGFSFCLNFGFVVRIVIVRDIVQGISILRTHCTPLRWRLHIEYWPNQILSTINYYPNEFFNSRLSALDQKKQWKERALKICAASFRFPSLSQLFQ